MPELPEVEVVRRGLENHVLRREITSVRVHHERPVRRHLGGPEDFRSRLRGRTFTAVRRRGKYFWLALDNGDALLGHLGMSGQMLVKSAEAPAERHLRVSFGLGVNALGADGTGDPDQGRRHDAIQMRFVDQRMFGGLLVSTEGAEEPEEISDIARDPLDPDFDEDAFVARVRKSSSGIKRILLNQSVVSGVGNIYADESLWRVKIHGEKPGERLTPKQVRELLRAARDVMNDALAQGGTSFDDLYVHVNGESGYFDRSLQAYGQEGEPCGHCGRPIRRDAFMNRSSYFCSNCQRVGRRPG